MKYTCPRICLLLGAAAAFGGTALLAQNNNSQVITMPVVKDGSNNSRAPLPAARPNNDVTPPTGQANNPDVPPPVAVLDKETQPHATINARTPAVEPGLMPTGRATVAAAGTLDATNVVATIRGDAFEARDQLTADIDARLKSADAAMKTYRSSTSQMSESGRAQFKAAEDDVRAKERALKKSLRRAKDAKAADWQSAREQLAADYQAYAQSLAQVDAAAGVH